VGKLRRKIDLPGAAPLFKTERGLGYMLHAI
jgi:DNA-binding response OmpR family regulator